jgi:hypothetical protein
MRTGISITVSASDRRRLQAVVSNAAQKHAWRAEIVVLCADGVGTNEIMRRTGKSKTCVWRWQERFMQPSTASSTSTTERQNPSPGPSIPTKLSPPSNAGTKR